MTSSTIVLNERQKNILYWLTKRQRETLEYVRRNQIVGGEDAGILTLEKKGLAKIVNAKPRRWILTDQGKLLATYLQTAWDAPSCDTNPLSALVPLYWAMNEITRAATIEQSREIATAALAEVEKTFDALSRESARPWTTAKLTPEDK